MVLWTRKWKCEALRVITWLLWGLTDEEIDSMLEVLQHPQTPVPQQRSLDDVLDEDLREVLGMDVDDFLVWEVF